MLLRLIVAEKRVDSGGPSASRGAEGHTRSPSADAWCSCRAGCCGARRRTCGCGRGCPSGRLSPSRRQMGKPHRCNVPYRSIPSQTRRRFGGGGVAGSAWRFGDGGHLEAGSLEGTDRLLATTAGPFTKTSIWRMYSPSRIAATRPYHGTGGEPEADQAGAAPAHLPGRVGDRHDRVVERRLDVRVPDRQPRASCVALTLCHGTPVYFLRRMPTVFFTSRRCSGSRCPRTGRLRRWRSPR